MCGNAVDTREEGGSSGTFPRQHLMSTRSIHSQLRGPHTSVLPFSRSTPYCTTGHAKRECATPSASSFSRCRCRPPPGKPPFQPCPPSTCHPRWSLRSRHLATPSPTIGRTHLPRPPLWPAAVGPHRQPQTLTPPLPPRTIRMAPALRRFLLHLRRLSNPNPPPQLEWQAGLRCRAIDSVMVAA
jgi:hypothetical protein